MWVVWAGDPMLTSGPAGEGSTAGGASHLRAQPAPLAFDLKEVRHHMPSLSVGLFLFPGHGVIWCSSVWLWTRWRRRAKDGDPTH